MKRYLAYVILLLLLASCGAESGRFRIEGRLANMNQAEFYIYNMDGGSLRLDTIKVVDGRFIYETDLEHQGTFVILYPNFSDQVVFGESGAVVEMVGDASHLKDMEVTGTDDNDLMTAWRIQANTLTPPEVNKSAVEFIKEHPASIVSNYLLSRYLVLDDSPDYQQAEELSLLLQKEQPQNGRLLNLSKLLAGLKNYQEGKKLPDFSATDINGKRVSRESLNGELNVICLWATWNYDSQSILRKLNKLRRDYGSRLTLLSICLEPSVKDCRRFVERDSMRWSHVCDGRMWESPLVTKLGFSDMPGNLFVDRHGKIVAVDVKNKDIEEKVKSFLK